MGLLRNQATTPTYNGASPGYQYPAMLEDSGSLHVIYSRNKEDIQIGKVALSDLP